MSNRQILHNPAVRKFVPPPSGSPFGEFPPSYEIRRKLGGAAGTGSRKKASLGETIPEKHIHTTFVRRGEGGGALCSSVRKPAPKAAPPPPRANAAGKRVIAPTEFRRFYDR
eukprot:PhM_4_TR10202/c5_g1_i2/m.40874